MEAKNTLTKKDTKKEVMKYGMTDDQIELIRRTVAAGASNDELALFLHNCKRTGLDPFVRQIYLLPIQGKRVIQISIDGARLIAERTEKYKGQTSPEWCGEDGEWKDVWLSSDPPLAARVGIYKEGFERPLFAVAHYKSYVRTYFDKNTNSQKLMPSWEKMPEVMLSKCAESLALRKAFPQQLGDLYTAEELGGDDNSGGQHPDAPAPKRPGSAFDRNSAISELKQLMKTRKFDAQIFLEYYDRGSVEEFDDAQIKDAIESLKKKPENVQTLEADAELVGDAGR